MWVDVTAFAILLHKQSGYTGLSTRKESDGSFDAASLFKVKKKFFISKKELK